MLGPYMYYNYYTQQQSYLAQCILDWAPFIPVAHNKCFSMPHACILTPTDRVPNEQFLYMSNRPCIAQKDVC